MERKSAHHRSGGVTSSSSSHAHHRAHANSGFSAPIPTRTRGAWRPEHTSAARVKAAGGAATAAAAASKTIGRSSGGGGDGAPAHRQHRREGSILRSAGESYSSAAAATKNTRFSRPLHSAVIGLHRPPSAEEVAAAAIAAAAREAAVAADRGPPITFAPPQPPRTQRPASAIDHKHSSPAAPKPRRAAAADESIDYARHVTVAPAGGNQPPPIAVSRTFVGSNGVGRVVGGESETLIRANERAERDRRTKQMAGFQYRSLWSDSQPPATRVIRPDGDNGGGARNVFDESPRTMRAAAEADAAYAAQYMMRGGAAGDAVHIRKPHERPDYDLAFRKHEKQSLLYDPLKGGRAYESDGDDAANEESWGDDGPNGGYGPDVESKLDARDSHRIARWRKAITVGAAGDRLVPYTIQSDVLNIRHQPIATRDAFDEWEPTDRPPLVPASELPAARISIAAGMFDLDAGRVKQPHTRYTYNPTDSLSFAQHLRRGYGLRSYVRPKFSFAHSAQLGAAAVLYS